MQVSWFITGAIMAAAAHATDDSARAQALRINMIKRRP
jgi:hypothetical protein